MNKSLPFAKKLTHSSTATSLLLAILCLFCNSSFGQSNCTTPVFPAPADIIGQAPEAAGYNLVYHLPIPFANQTWTSQDQIPYTINNAAALSGTPFTRIAYYMKLESIYLGVQWVWVSFDAFTNNVTLTGIPTGSTIWQQVVKNMNVINYAGVNKTGVDGNVEIWGHCYTPDNTLGIPGADDTRLDFGDAPNADENCYGSFQVHDFADSNTLLAYNGWSFIGGSFDDMGINSQPGENSSPDWTLSQNSFAYDVRELYVFVNTGTIATCKNATLYLDASGKAELKPEMVSDAVAGTCGVVTVDISKAEFSCADKGENSVTVTVTDLNGKQNSCTALVTVSDTIPPTLKSTGTTLSLSCNPTADAIDAALGTATVKDNCESAVVNFTDGDVVVNNCSRSQTRTWTAVDAAGNSATSISRTVTWKQDDTAPIINVTGTTLDLGCNPSTVQINAALGSATVTDACGDPTLNIFNSGVSVDGCLNLQTRTWTASDVCGNEAFAVSRTVMWKVDRTVPVITASGTTLTLTCNPSTQALEAALGSATVIDNCGTPNLVVTTGTTATAGTNNTKTRTWNATDACGNIALTVSRTVTWPASCINLNHFYTSDVTCGQYVAASRPPLANICYQTKGKNVSSASPSKFIYYATITAPANLGLLRSFVVDVVQTKTCNNFPLYSLDEIDAYESNCAMSGIGVQLLSGQGRVYILGATPGRTYTIAARYETRNLVGAALPSSGTVCQNNFATVVNPNILAFFGVGTAVPNSQGSIKAVANCSAARFAETMVDTRAVLVDNLTATVQPNPSNSAFTLTVRSQDNLPVSVKITDMYGRVIQVYKNVQVNSSLRVGQSWLPGMYIVEAQQGNQSTVVKMVKTN